MLRQQLKLIWLKRRRELLFLAGAAAVVAVLRMSEAFRPAGLAFQDHFVATPIFFLLSLTALFWPGAMWSNEGPGDRAYHWSLPVRRSVHDLTRAGVGGLGLLLTLAVGLAAGLAASGLIWGATAHVGSWEIVGATVLTLLLSYLLGTVPALVSDHPFRWIAGVFIGVSLARMAAEGLALWRPALFSPLRDAFAALWEVPYGLEAALAAPRHLVRPSAAPGAEPWGALLLWLGIALAAVTWVAHLHVERAKGAAE